ncbi:MAG: CotH kinase family protein [Candidatus Neomarinimicrobiota bacterium]
MLRYAGMILFFCGNLLPQEILPRLFINEFIASNINATLDSRYNEYSDWLEIYNAEDTTVLAGGLFLTDDLSEPLKWQIPVNTSIAANSFLVIWMDGHDTELHASFKLSGSGEQIGLFSVDGSAIDTISYPVQSADIAYGRYPDAGTNWRYFQQPTPGSANISQPSDGLVPNPRFSHNGGFYHGAQNIGLTTIEPDAVIHYTLDGSPPSDDAPVYSGPIAVTATVVIRAQATKSGYLPSAVITNTYFIDESVTLPVVSVATDPDNLWSDQTGIYVEGTNGIPGYCLTTARNWNQDWERPISIELFEKDGSRAFGTDAGMKIGGGCTRKYPQKTLAIYARSIYGASRINYRIFDDKNISSFNNINLRNSGQDWYRTLFRDGLMQTIVKDRMDIDWQAYKPAILFLNGEYWGIHAIREKHNEHYLEDNYGVDPDKVDILVGQATVKNGSAATYNTLLNYIKSTDLSVAASFNYVKSRIDINEYLDYLVAEIYFANIDWPGGNIKYWRPQGDGNKWRWILFDTDLGFGAHELGQYNSNSLANATAETSTYYANPSWSTLLLRKMLTNEEFRSQFIQRFASHINTTFQTDHVLHIIDSLQANIAAEIPRHKAKWSASLSFGATWEAQVEIIREFARKRPEYMISHLTEKFVLSGMANLTASVSESGAGYILLGGVSIPDDGFTGQYFRDVSLECRAIPAKGYRFAGWQGISDATDSSIAIVLTGDAELQAVFERDGIPGYTGLVINEFMAINNSGITNSLGNYEDWIELYNDSDVAIDVGGLYMTDDLEKPGNWQIPLTFPDSTTIQPGGFLLLWADKELSLGIRHLDFKLNGEGEQIGLALKTGDVFIYIDSLTFGAQTADISYGLSPNRINCYEYFWLPTPDYTNLSSSVGDKTNVRVAEFSGIDQNFPNPFNPSTSIRFRLAQSGFVSLNIYDVLGNEVASLIDNNLPEGAHEVVFNGKDVSSGIYFYLLRSGDFMQVRKMLLIK